MVGKAKAVAHGANVLRYISGESHKKDDKADRITRIADNGLDGLGATAMWESMQLACSGHGKMRNTIIRFELCPELADTQDFTAKDWQDLWNEYLEVFDSIELKDKKGNVTSPKTNVRGSLFTVWLHEESNSGIPHLHAVASRVDQDGNTNNDSNINIRAIRAAEIVSRRRGWSVAADIHLERAGDISKVCFDVLRDMPRWSWDDYVKRLSEKGWNVGERRDSNGVLRGYAIRKGNIKYKASELGKGRNLMVKNLEKTWRKLHEVKPAKADKLIERKPKASSKPAPKPTPLKLPDYRQYLSYRDWHVPFYVTHQGEDMRLFIPQGVVDFFNDTFDHRQFSNTNDLIETAVSVFVGLAVPPDDVHVGTGGGGSSDDRGWGRDPKEDDIEWAKRCAAAARHITKPRRKSGGKSL